MVALMNRKIKNINDDFIEIEVIRYFINNDVEYLIYSLNEIDESGYIKLYASKIIGSKACIITDNDEWNLVKEIIKEVVRSNRDGNPLNISDLAEENLEDIVLQDTRVFKLQGNLVTLLSENKKVEKENNNSAIIKDDNIIEENVDFEKLYNSQLERNEELKEKIEQLEQQLSDYKEKTEDFETQLIVYKEKMQLIKDSLDQI